MIGKWTRERGFGLGSRGSKWWVARVNHDGNVNEENPRYGERPGDYRSA
jgi:hypothetical protein